MEEENFVVLQLDYVMEKKCRDVNRKCSFVGPSFITKERVRCHWVRKNGHSKQNKCCTFIKRCKVSGKVKNCKTSKVGCHFRGTVIRTKRVKKCHRRKFGRNGIRVRCCSWNTSCNLKKQCKKVRVRCSWKGKATYVYLKNKCEFKKKSKTIQQRFCCSWKKKCIAKKCKNLEKQCKWTGRIYVTKRNVKCFWIKVGLNTRRRKCCAVKKRCHHVKKHHHKNCKKLSKKCKFIGSPVSKKKLLQNVNGQDMQDFK